MKSKLNLASMLAIGATVVTAMVGAGNTGAAAQDKVPDGLEIVSRFSPEYTSQPMVQPLPEDGNDEMALPPVDGAQTPHASATTLAALVSAQPQPGELSREMQCLAGAIYFEARGESLNGQLAVGRVIVARSKSGRFPDSYCGVVFQRSQFSFVQGNRMPQIRTASRDWRDAVAIAQISHAGSWRSPAEGALFFHATHVSPGWRLSRVARIENHVFYR